MQLSICNVNLGRFSIEINAFETLTGTCDTDSLNM